MCCGGCAFGAVWVDWQRVSWGTAKNGDTTASWGRPGYLEGKFWGGKEQNGRIDEFFPHRGGLVTQRETAGCCHGNDKNGTPDLMVLWFFGCHSYEFMGTSH